MTSGPLVGACPDSFGEPVSGGVPEFVPPQGKRIAAFEDEMVAFFISAADTLGVPRSVAAIYGICFASPVPLSFADIHARLDISQGSISQGVRILKEMGALKVVGCHKRRDYFSPDLALRRWVARFLEERLEKQLKHGVERLDALASMLPQAGEGAKELHVRLKYLRQWYGRSKALVPLIKIYLKTV